MNHSEDFFRAARIRIAAARGQTLPSRPALDARRAEFAHLQQAMTDAGPRFLDTLVGLRGERIWTFGAWNMAYNMAKPEPPRAPAIGEAFPGTANAPDAPPGRASGATVNPACQPDLDRLREWPGQWRMSVNDI